MWLPRNVLLWSRGCTAPKKGPMLKIHSALKKNVLRCASGMEVKTLRNVFKQNWPLGFQKQTYFFIELVQQFTNTWRHKNKFNNNRFRIVPYNSALCFFISLLDDFHPWWRQTGTKTRQKKKEKDNTWNGVSLKSVCLWGWRAKGDGFPGFHVCEKKHRRTDVCERACVLHSSTNNECCFTDSNDQLRHLASRFPS